MLNIYHFQLLVTPFFTKAFFLTEEILQPCLRGPMRSRDVFINSPLYGNLCIVQMNNNSSTWKIASLLNEQNRGASAICNYKVISGNLTIVKLAENMPIDRIILVASNTLVQFDSEKLVQSLIDKKLIDRKQTIEELSIIGFLFSEDKQEQANKTEENRLQNLYICFKRSEIDIRLISSQNQLLTAGMMEYKYITYWIGLRLFWRLLPNSEAGLIVYKRSYKPINTATKEPTFTLTEQLDSEAPIERLKTVNTSPKASFTVGSIVVTYRLMFDPLKGYISYNALDKIRENLRKGTVIINADSTAFIVLMSVGGGEIVINDLNPYKIMALMDALNQSLYQSTFERCIDNLHFNYNKNRLKAFIQQQFPVIEDAFKRLKARIKGNMIAFLLVRSLLLPIAKNQSRSFIWVILKIIYHTACGSRMKIKD